MEATAQPTNEPKRLLLERRRFVGRLGEQFRDCAELRARTGGRDFTVAMAREHRGSGEKA